MQHTSDYLSRDRLVPPGGDTQTLYLVRVNMQHMVHFDSYREALEHVVKITHGADKLEPASTTVSRWFAYYPNDTEIIDIELKEVLRGVKLSVPVAPQSVRSARGEW